jgi:hypothetical protein
MSVEYEYNITDFKNHRIQNIGFRSQISQSSISAKFEGIKAGTYPKIILVFSKSLSEAEVVTLTNIISNHNDEIVNNFTEEKAITLGEQQFITIFTLEKILSSGIHIINWSFFIDILKKNHKVEYQILVNDTIFSSKIIKNQISISQRKQLIVETDGLYTVDLKIKCKNNKSIVNVEDISFWFDNK